MIFETQSTIAGAFFWLSVWAVFGSITRFTDGDVAELAAALAKELLAQHYERAGRSPTGKKLPGDATTGLNKPGWFEPGDAVDFSTTVF